MYFISTAPVFNIRNENQTDVVEFYNPEAGDVNERTSITQRGSTEGAQNYYFYQGVLSPIGEGKTVEEAMDDFNQSYAGMRDYHERHGKGFEEVEYAFYYDTASFLQEFSKAFSLSGLERITGVSQTQLGHYLHGRRRPSAKTVARIQKGVEQFAHNLTAVRFA
jgi:hypothetical protein